MRNKKPSGRGKKSNRSKKKPIAGRPVAKRAPKPSKKPTTPKPAAAQVRVKGGKGSKRATVRVVNGKVSFSNVDSESVISNLEQFEAKVRILFGRVSGERISADATINLRDMINALPRHMQLALMEEYKSIIGFENVMRRISGTSAIKTFKAPGRDRPYSSINVDLASKESGKLDPLSVIYNRLTLTEDYVTGELTPGRNIISVSHLKELMEPKEIGPGSKILVFDTETSRLGIGAVREVSAITVDVAEETGSTVYNVDPSSVFARHLRTSQMQLGTVRDPASGRLTTIGDFVGGQYVHGGPGSGKAFSGVVDELIDAMDSSDFIAGQNIQFDLQQIFGSIKSTSEYKLNPKFRAKVDAAMQKLSGKIIDTLELARLHMPDLDVARELSFRADMTPYSMSNILLKTNLSDLIISEIGEDRFKELLGVGGIGRVHVGEVDAMIEAFFLKGLKEGSLQVKDLTNQEIKRAILSSYAPTPSSQIRDIRQISSPALQRAIERGRIHVPDPRTGEPVGLSEAGITKDEFVRRIADDSDKLSSEAIVDMTPVEHRAITERELSKIHDNLEQFRGDVTFRGLSTSATMGSTEGEGRGFLDSLGQVHDKSVFPTLSEYKKYQLQALRTGDPLGALSLPERVVTEGVRSATSLIAGTPIEKEAAEIGKDLGMSFFGHVLRPHVSSIGAVSMPANLIRLMEEKGVLETNLSARPDKPLQMARVSVGRNSRTGKYFANLAIDVEREQLQKAGEYLLNIIETDSERAKEMFGTENLQKVIAYLEEMRQGTAGIEVEGGKVAVTVGRINDDATAKAISDVFAPFQNPAFRGGSDITASNVFKAPILDAETRESIRVGPFAMVETFSEEEEKQFRTLSRIIDERYSKIVSNAVTNERASKSAAGRSRIVRETVASIEEGVRGGGTVDSSKSILDDVLDFIFGKPDPLKVEQELEEVAKRSSDLTQKVLKGAPIATAAILGAAALKYSYGKLKDRKRTEETFSTQRYEGKEGDYYLLQQQVAQMASQRNIDPLATAGVVGNLRNNSSNRNIMGTGKYANIFNGLVS